MTMGEPSPGAGAVGILQVVLVFLAFLWPVILGFFLAVLGVVGLGYLIKRAEKNSTIPKSHTKLPVPHSLVPHSASKCAESCRQGDCLRDEKLKASVAILLFCSRAD
jgi:hypothetical protein